MEIPKPLPTQLNDWLIFRFEHTPDHTWVLIINYGRDGYQKFYRRFESGNFRRLFRR